MVGGSTPSHHLLCKGVSTTGTRKTTQLSPWCWRTPASQRGADRVQESALISTAATAKVSSIFAIAPSSCRFYCLAHVRLWNDYFSEAPVYGTRLFRRRFRMSKDVFLRVTNAVALHDTYFEQSRDAVGRVGIFCTHALAHG